MQKDHTEPSTKGDLAALRYEIKEDIEVAVAQIAQAVGKALENTATKEDLKEFATKKDLKRVEDKVDGLDDKVTDMSLDVTDIKRRMTDLEADTPSLKDMEKIVKKLKN